MIVENEGKEIVDVVDENSVGPSHGVASESHHQGLPYNDDEHFQAFVDMRQAEAHRSSSGLDFAMSDCFSDLLCAESCSGIISPGSRDYSPEYSSDLDSRPPDAVESISGLLEDERDLAGLSSFRAVDQPIDSSIRSEFIAWILKVHRYYGFQPLTAYLSVNYFDRFICCHHLPKMSGWPLQLLSVACLSLAAKMEERLVPSLLDLQVEDAKYIFEPKTVQRMELLVLRILDWRLGSISPFCYLSFFAHKIDPFGIYTDFLTTRAKEIILSTIKETSLLECRPSCIAATATLCAANDLPKFTLITAHHAESWCDGLNKDEIMMIRLKMKAKKQPKVFPEVSGTYRASTDSLSSSSSSFKRNSGGMDENKGTRIKRVKYDQELHN
ncbi:cyclin-D1-1-like [Salvia hispanica]|uniref:cyclin-D1-1-like n=1 Tax=Salvia hispanica TaxID=49212 RepID=UPI002009C068|nr:cyclin-D1-1-like [Salvia hispanica]